MDLKIDLVYLWCDGNEPAFRKRREKYQKECGKTLSKENGNCRYVQIDELKYSLRSVEKFVPWINRIYIVCDRQIPVWLNVNHPKIFVIDHSEIIPKEYSPLFNSTAIECFIGKIKGLSEHFLLANDDTFFGRSLKPSFFFDDSGRAKVRVVKAEPCDDMYGGFLKNAVEKIQRKFGVSFLHIMPHHNIDAYLKSDYNEAFDAFNDDVQRTATHRFREADDLHRFVVSLYMLYKASAVLKDTSYVLGGRFFRHFGLAKRDSLTLDNYKNLNKIRSCRPGLFCINDTENSQPEDRKKVQCFLEEMFPYKSEFEL